jgi:ClpP class serine protease
MSWADDTEFWSSIGINFKALTNEGADLKSTFHLEPDEAQLAFLQESINEAGAAFRSHVEANRKGINPEVFRAGWYSGEKAKSLGLIDALGTLDSSSESPAPAMRHQSAAPSQNLAPRSAPSAASLPPKPIMKTAISTPPPSPTEPVAAVKPSFAHLHGMDRVKASMQWDASEKMRIITDANKANAPAPASEGAPVTAASLAAAIIDEQEKRANAPTGYRRTADALKKHSEEQAANKAALKKAGF